MQIAYPSSFAASLHCRTVAVALMAATCIAKNAIAQSCLEIGLVPGTANVLVLSQASHADRSTVAYRDFMKTAWFLPLQGDIFAGTPCVYENVRFWKISAADAALNHDPDTDLLTYLDMRIATNIIDARKAPPSVSAGTIDSLVINYQLSTNRSAGRFNPSATADVNGYTKGWYFNTGLAWNGNGRIARYESYALRQSVDSGTFLRLGDSITQPTALGESLQFAGLSWGIDRNLQPGNFAPVLPDVRSGNALSGPLQIFINDTLQFQQMLQTGVYDLRNVPAQQGFNSYSVRSLNALGNAVTVNREIYLPATLLPPGVQTWRVDVGLQRKEFFASNSNYQGPLIAVSYSAGLDHDTTLGARALVSQAASSASAAYDKRLSALWTGHIGLLTATTAVQRGSGLEVRMDGAGRQWRLLADWTQAFKPIPGLGEQAALVAQKLLRAQYSGVPNLSLGLTLTQSTRELKDAQTVATLSASSRIFDTGTVVSAGLTQTRANTIKQNYLTISLIVPLAPSVDKRSNSFYASKSSVDGTQLSRFQYASNGDTPESGNWGVGATKDSRNSLSVVDASWTRNTDRFALDASARIGAQSSSAQASIRSGFVWTGGAMFSTRPITGAFALVATGEKDIPVLFENRYAGHTNKSGLLLIPGLIPAGINRVRLDSTKWPINWTSSDIEKEVVPPRGAGVLVPFKINTLAWPIQTFLRPLQPGGQTFPVGTLVYASVNGDEKETVVDREGKIWIGELIPATMFTIHHKGLMCKFRLLVNNTIGEVASIQPDGCEKKK